MGGNDERRRGREAHARQAWDEAYQLLSSADQQSSLDPEDLERLATAAYLVGRDAVCDDVLARAHRGFLDRDDVRGAVRCAFWLGYGLSTRGETAQGGGWLSRAQRLCEEHALDCAERGYVLMSTALHKMESGEAAEAAATFDDVIRTGHRFGDPDVMAFGRLGRGESLIRLGRTRNGLALLDEVMTSVTSGEVSSRVSGTVYCAVVDTCQKLFDIGRAREWTVALNRWCDSQPGLVPYRGQCLVHRSQLMQLHGDWGEAMTEADRARDRLSKPPHPALGMAHYQVGELHRLQGDVTRAEEAYRRANELGRPPYPGLPLLWLAQGRVDAAARTIQGALDNAVDALARIPLLPARVEIMLATGAASRARPAAEELEALAAEIGTPLVAALAAQSTGAVQLAENDPSGAVERLSEAWQVWRELDAPYEGARTRVLLGVAHRELGNGETAELEWDAARATFEQLGAVPQVARLDDVAEAGAPATRGPLTQREVEVLRLVAAGRTNQQIADDLVISKKTVERHISNLFLKLDVSNRAAATAYAYEHDFV